MNIIFLYVQIINFINININQLNFNLFSKLRGDIFSSKSLQLYPDSLLPKTSELFLTSSNSLGTS